ncbi:unnamed protein product [Prorocentrum cordatum]|uniref:Uncharacterized protein n=1 Tax=Prorocentrum cordatum TaxID=2364126 RepID=A0ABN9TLI1_9DINO|nr:unnamed protein product [Polarella glacialis]
MSSAESAAAMTRRRRQHSADQHRDATSLLPGPTALHCTRAPAPTGGWGAAGQLDPESGASGEQKGAPARAPFRRPGRRWEEGEEEEEEDGGRRVREGTSSRATLARRKGAPMRRAACPQVRPSAAAGSLKFASAREVLLGSE